MNLLDRLKDVGSNEGKALINLEMARLSILGAEKLKELGCGNIDPVYEAMKDTCPVQSVNVAVAFMAGLGFGLEHAEGKTLSAKTNQELAQLVHTMEDFVLKDKSKEPKFIRRSK